MSSVTRKPTRSPEHADKLRTERHDALHVLWKESNLSRIRHCGSSLSKHSGDGNTVSLKYSDGIAGFSGLQSCGSVHACPCCSQKIMASRAQDVQDAVDSWHKLYKGRVIFLTLTMRHNKTQPLDMLLDAGSYGWSKVTSGRGWKKDAELYGEHLPREVKTGKHKGETVWDWRINYVRALEVTHSYRNGWHAHFHSLLFVRDGITDDEVAMLGQSIYGRWANALVAKGLTSPSPEHGIDTKLVRRGDSSALGDYFTKNSYVGRIKADKAGFEVAYSAGKGQYIDPYTGKVVRKDSRTPFGILADVVALGDADSLDLWHEWEKASQGRRQLTWSNGLRWILSLGVEKSDQEIVEEDLGGTVLMTFDRDEWRTLRWHSATILQLACSGIHEKTQLLSMLWNKQKVPSPLAA